VHHILNAQKSYLNQRQKGLNPDREIVESLRATDFWSFVAMSVEIKQ